MLTVLAFVFCGLAQPNWENARRAVATARTATEKYLFMTRYSFWEQIENRFFILEIIMLLCQIGPRVNSDQPAQPNHGRYPETIDL
jgi:hypothetical protein